MIICIAGLSGSGKNSVGELVAKKLGLKLVNPTFKTIAAKKKMSLMDFHRKAEADHGIDKAFDSHLISETKKGNCVVTTWLGPWMVKNADIRVWLYAPRSDRAARIAKRDKMTLEEAMNHVAERDENNHVRYHEIYKINIYDHSGFDLVLNSDKFLPEDSSNIIVSAACTKTGQCTCACHLQKGTAAKKSVKESAVPAKKPANVKKAKPVIVAKMKKSAKKEAKKPIKNSIKAGKVPAKKALKKKSKKR